MGKKSVKVPMVHLNGTSKGELEQQLREAVGAVRKAIDAMGRASPHGRDYYPQGPDAFSDAMREHVLRVAVLEGVRDELMQIWEGVNRQGKQG